MNDDEHNKLIELFKDLRCAAVHKTAHEETVMLYLESITNGDVLGIAVEVAKKSYRKYTDLQIEEN